MNPLVLGGGNALFRASGRKVRMKLLEARPLRSGCVILRCQPEPGMLEEAVAQIEVSRHEDGKK